MLKQDAIQHFGNAAKLASALDVSRQAIHKWPEEVPDNWQFRLHHITGGKLALSPRLEGEGRAQ